MRPTSVSLKSWPRIIMPVIVCPGAWLRDHHAWGHRHHNLRIQLQRSSGAQASVTSWYVRKSRNDPISARDALMTLQGRPAVLAVHHLAAPLAPWTLLLCSCWIGRCYRSLTKGSSRPSVCRQKRPRAGGPATRRATRTRWSGRRCPTSRSAPTAAARCSAEGDALRAFPGTQGIVGRGCYM